MLNIREISQEEVVNFFTNDPKLAIMGLSDELLDYLYHKKEFNFSQNGNVLGLFLENELIFIFKYQYFSNIALNVHLYLATKARRKKIFTEITETLKTWMKANHPHISKIIVLSPEPCRHVTRIAKNYGFQLEGIIKQGFKWRLEIVDINIFGMELI